MAEERDLVKELFEQRRPIRPQPEIVDPRIIENRHTWTIREGKGLVYQEAHELEVPLDESEHSWHVRMHENAHIAYSETRMLPDIPWPLQNAAEDWRIHQILSRELQGFDVQVLNSAEAMEKMFANMLPSGDPVLICAGIMCVYEQSSSVDFANAWTKGIQVIRDGLVAADPSLSPGVVETALIKDLMQYRKLVQQTCTAAHRMISSTMPGPAAMAAYDARLSRLWAKLVWEAIQTAQENEPDQDENGNEKTQAQRAFDAAQQINAASQEMPSNTGMDGGVEANNRVIDSMLAPQPPQYPTTPSESNDPNAKGATRSMFRENDEKTSDSEIRSTMRPQMKQHGGPDEWWSKMEIENPPKPLILRSDLRHKKFQLTEEGAVPMAMHRATSDGKIFGIPKRKRGGASVLVDISGSMSLSSDQVIQMLSLVPGALIAVYSGNASIGKLAIVAQNGHRVRDEVIKRLSSEYGFNGVDGPALEWLAKQKGPRYWVSDGHINGRNHNHHIGMWDQVQRLQRRFKIRRFPTMESVQKFHVKEVLSKKGRR